MTHSRAIEDSNPAVRRVSMLRNSRTPYRRHKGNYDRRAG
jgi:hypothetical protein